MPMTYLVGHDDILTRKPGNDMSVNMRDDISN